MLSRLARSTNTRTVPDRPTGTHPVVKGPLEAPPRERPGSSNEHDRAVYTCSGGYQFEAIVSTSVRCPHCGETQAW